jgi:hypothetical protein
MTVAAIETTPAAATIDISSVTDTGDSSGALATEIATTFGAASPEEKATTTAAAVSAAETPAEDPLRQTKAALLLTELDSTTYPLPSSLPWSTNIESEINKKNSKFHTDLIILDLKLPLLRGKFGTKDHSDQIVLNLVAWVYEIAEDCEFGVVGLQMAVFDSKSENESGSEREGDAESEEASRVSCMLVLKSMTKVG